MAEINSVPDEGIESDYMYEPEVDREDIGLPHEGASEFLKKKRKAQKESKSYRKLFYERMALPVYAQRQQILNTLKRKQVGFSSFSEYKCKAMIFFRFSALLMQVVLIQAETGSGKSTQVPQIILEDAIEQGRGANTNIIVTQPRRISAISLAKRVGKEFGDRKVNLLSFHQIMFPIICFCLCARSRRINDGVVGLSAACILLKDLVFNPDLV